MRRAREALRRLAEGGFGEALRLEANARPVEGGGATALVATATVGELFRDGVASLASPTVCFRTSSGAAPACANLADGAATFRATVTGASPGVHALTAWLDADGADAACSDALGSASAEALWYAADPATGAYWRPSGVSDARPCDVTSRRDHQQSDAAKNQQKRRCSRRPKKTPAGTGGPP